MGERADTLPRLEQLCCSEHLLLALMAGTPGPKNFCSSNRNCQLLKAHCDRGVHSDTPLKQWSRRDCLNPHTALARTEDTCGRFLNGKHRVLCHHWRRFAAVAAAVAAAAVMVVLVSVAVALALASKFITRCRVLSFRCLVSLPFSFPISLPLPLRLSSGSSRACSAALLAARHVRRRPRAVHKGVPLSTQIHQAFLHHLMCLFDTSFSSCVEFISFFASTHSSCVVISSSLPCPSWASASLSFSLRSSRVFPSLACLSRSS